MKTPKPKAQTFFGLHRRKLKASKWKRDWWKNHIVNGSGIDWWLYP